MALVLYLVPHYLNGLAENWEIAALFVGAVLIALEVLVIPGFGVAGVAGLVLTVGSLTLIMLNNQNFDFFFVDPSDIVQAAATTLAGMLGGYALIVLRRGSPNQYRSVSAGYHCSIRRHVARGTPPGCKLPCSWAKRGKPLLSCGPVVR